jgi:hypothetical protein
MLTLRISERHPTFAGREEATVTLSLPSGKEVPLHALLLGGKVVFSRPLLGAKRRRDSDSEEDDESSEEEEDSGPDETDVMRRFNIPKHARSPPSGKKYVPLSRDEMSADVARTLENDWEHLGMHRKPMNRANDSEADVVAFTCVPWALSDRFKTRIEEWITSEKTISEEDPSKMCSSRLEEALLSDWKEFTDESTARLYRGRCISFFVFHDATGRGRAPSIGGVALWGFRSGRDDGTVDFDVDEAFDRHEFLEKIEAIRDAHGDEAADSIKKNLGGFLAMAAGSSYENAFLAAFPDYRDERISNVLQDVDEPEQLKNDPAFLDAFEMLAGVNANLSRWDVDTEFYVGHRDADVGVPRCLYVSLVCSRADYGSPNVFDSLLDLLVGEGRDVIELERINRANHTAFFRISLNAARARVAETYRRRGFRSIALDPGAVNPNHREQVVDTRHMVTSPRVLREDVAREVSPKYVIHQTAKVAKDYSRISGEQESYLLPRWYASPAFLDAFFELVGVGYATASGFERKGSKASTSSFSASYPEYDVPLPKTGSLPTQNRLSAASLYRELRVDARFHDGTFDTIDETNAQERRVFLVCTQSGNRLCAMFAFGEELEAFHDVSGRNAKYGRREAALLAIWAEGVTNEYDAARSVERACKVVSRGHLQYNRDAFGTTDRGVEVAISPKLCGTFHYQRHLGGMGFEQEIGGGWITTYEPHDV